MSNSDLPAQHSKELAAARTHTWSHEKDDRWTVVDQYAIKHLHPPGSANYAAINYAIQLAEEKQLPSIEVSLLQGKWLQTQCQLIDAQHVLEVGTLGGISSIWLGTSSSRVRVTTIEIAPERKAVAEQAIAHAGLSERVEVMLGAGMDVLPKLRQEVARGERSKFDMVFIDADKPNNLNYFNEAIQMVRSRGCIIVDNVVRRGRVADDELAKTDSQVEGARRVIEGAGADERVLGHTLLQTVGEKNYDGMLICVIK